MKNIITKNSKEQYHGYHESYNKDKSWYRGNYINDKRIGHSEYHWCKITIFYIK